MKPIVLFRIFFVFASLMLGSAIVRAEDLSAVKARMEQRQSTVDALKERKVVGENNRGYLEARASLKPDEEKVLSDENTDRATVYAALAAQTGSSSDQVGRLRATKIAASSKGGVWVQSTDGNWAQKS
jgi:uncharacterized protein YdbL (DUF1318 family)